MPKTSPRKTGHGRHPASMTLAEVLIAIGLFSMLSIMGVQMLQTVTQARQKVEMQEYLYTETQALINRMARTIQNSMLDYEEYYSLNVVGATDYGENYGEYHKQFFDPGSDLAYGGQCTDGSAYPDSDGCPAGFLPDTTTFDHDTGQNPYLGSGGNPEDANALCASGSGCTTTIDTHQVDGLFLISTDGTTRTYFVLEDGDVPAIAMVVLEGTDTDGNGIMDTWACAPEFTCTGGGGSLPSGTDLTAIDGVDEEDFFPISPKSLHIDELIFYIAPIEDPFKGYAETNSATFENVQLQPRVTILLTVHYQLYDDSGNAVDFEDYANLLGQAPTIQLQTTVSLGGSEVVPAYSYP